MSERMGWWMNGWMDGGGALLSDRMGITMIDDDF